VTRHQSASSRPVDLHYSYSVLPLPTVFRLNFVYHLDGE
jgi:hypothetical protein